MILGTAPISWKWKRQTIVFKSPSKAEHHSMSSTSSKIVCLWRLLWKLGVFLRSVTPLHAENISVIKIVTYPMFHERTKHIEIDCHLICQHVLYEPIKLPHRFSTSGSWSLYQSTAQEPSWLSNYQIDALSTPLQYECKKTVTHRAS